MFSSCFFATLCLMLCLSVCPSRGRTLHQCDPYLNWNYTKEVIATMNHDILDIAFSKHTGNIYLAVNGSDFLMLSMGSGSSNRNITVASGKSIAIDHIVPKVYVATPNEIPIYDELSGEQVSKIDFEVTNLFLAGSTNDLYLVNGYKQHVYRYINQTVFGDTNIYTRWDHPFVVDMDGNYIYTAEGYDSVVTKIQLNRFHDTITYSGGPYAHLTVDNMGRVFGSKGSSIYNLKSDGSSFAEFVAELDFTPKCMCFDDNDNVLFGTSDRKVVILKLDNKCDSP